VLVYARFTLLWDSGVMDMDFARMGLAPVRRPDLPSLLADLAARQFRSPTAMIQAEASQQRRAAQARTSGTTERPASFSPDVAEAILSGEQPL
jgi:hypothetical protein